MAHNRNKLTVRKILSLGPGTYGDGGGLWLRVTNSGSRQWIYRFRFNGKARAMGLGGLDKVSLAKARQRRDEVESMVLNRLDPIKERRKSEQKAATDSITLAEIAEIAFKARQAHLKADGKAGRWFGPVKLHILPKLGQMSVSDITQRDIQKALEPIWHSKADTANKAINRLNMIIKHAVAMGLDVDIQAVDKAKALLGGQRHTVKHIPSMPSADIPSFYASLTETNPVQLALRLLILNPGPRSKPIRFLQLDHIEGNVWTIPSDLMKGRKGRASDWRTLLCGESLAVIEQAKPFERNGYLFPNRSGKGVISDASMSRLMERRGLRYRPHGFRASFKTWATENKRPRDIVELCLAHKIYGAVEASYLRTDQLEERGRLMKAWSEHVKREL